MIPVAANDLMKSLEEPPEHYLPFPSIEDVRNFKATTFAFDIECPKYRIMGESAPAEMVGLSAAATHAMCVPIRGEYLPELKRIFRDAKVIIGHNSIQFDMPRLRAIGIKESEECVHYDTMLLQHLVFPDFPHDLEFVGSQFVSKPAWKSDKEVLQTYCCRDTDVTYTVWTELLPMVKKEQLLDLYLNVQVPLARICALMHETGFKVNPGRIADVRKKLEAQLIEEEKFLPEFLRSHDILVNKRHPAPPGTLGKTGRPLKFVSRPEPKRVVPWRSPDVKAKYLYGPESSGGLSQERVLDLHSGNVTTGKMALAKIYSKTKNRAVEALRILNKIDETLSTFAKSDMLAISRMYPHFNVHGTASGRLSSSDPNLQNIPESARCIYVPSHTGWKIVDVDYSNIENRLTAILAGDSERLAKYADPKYSDYKLLVSRAYGIPESDVVKDNSREAPYGKAKAIVLGVNYGLGAKKISKMYDMPIQEVNRLLLTWKSEIKETTAWQIRTANEAIEKGVLVTPFGRRRWFWTSSAYTESLSFLPQSTAADLIFRAMIALMWKKIGWPEEKVKALVPSYKAVPANARLLLQVHDSLVWECPPEDVDELVATLKLVMEQPFKEIQNYSIPISIKIGDSWNDDA
jgi:DNA polymerase-1